MDFTQSLARAILDGGKPAYQEFLSRGIPADLLQGIGKPALDYIAEHLATYGTLPSIQIIEGKIGVPLPPNFSGATAGFWADEILTNAIGNKLKTAVDSTLDLLKDQKIHASFEDLQKSIFAIQQLRIGGTDARVTSLFEEGPGIMEYYERMKAGERGILTPWPSINDSTMGLNPEELILFVARSGIGKTWASLLVTECAWKGYKIPVRTKQEDGTYLTKEGFRKHKVLYVTTEMSKLRIALRFYSLTNKLPFGRLRSGSLTMHEEDKLRNSTVNLLKEQGLSIVGGNFDFRVETLAAAIDEVEPEMVVIDGIYLIKVEGKDRIEQAANAFSEVKRLTMTKKLPIVVTSQFNREVKKNQAATATAESVALTDAAVWHSTLIFGMVQTDDNRKEKRMQMKQLKVRDGAGEDFELDWDFDQMNFLEVPKGVGGPGSGGNISDAADIGGSDSGSSSSDNVPF